MSYYILGEDIFYNLKYFNIIYTMIYGRVIIVGQHYFNKIMDIQGISYFSNISGDSPRFISIDSDVLDRKMFNYSGNLLLK